MKQITNATIRLLVKGRSLVKFEDDPTEVYVFAGHPVGEYSGEVNERVILLNSLTTSEYRRFDTMRDMGKGAVRLYLLENEDDVLDPLGKPTGEPKAPGAIAKFFGAKGK